MKKQTKFTHVTPKEFKSIKVLQRAGVNANQTSRATKRTYRTIANIFNSDTFQDYKKVASQHINKEPIKQLASTETLSEVIRQAKHTGGLIITTHAAFVGFEDVYDFVKEASDNAVTVTFAPMVK